MLGFGCSGLRCYGSRLWDLKPGLGCTVVVWGFGGRGCWGVRVLGLEVLGS